MTGPTQVLFEKNIDEIPEKQINELIGNLLGLGYVPFMALKGDENVTEKVLREKDIPKSTRNSIRTTILGSNVTANKERKEGRKQ